MKVIHEDVEELDLQIQYACQRKMLFQGHDWLCPRCKNRNWVTIDRMGAILSCDVCGWEKLPPVSADWHFRANPFVVEAYRDHGVESVIWMLWQLWKRARRSFYFAPSMQLWENDPESEDARSVEVDAFVVVDGKVYVCEAKSSPGLTDRQATQLVAVAQMIRPDALLIACMDQMTSRMRTAAEQIRGTLGEDVRVELLGFKPEA